jgi:hypothetical protein
MSAAPERNKTRFYTSILDFTVRRMPGFASLIFAMLVSRQIAGFPFYGAIWFLTGQVFLLGAEAYYKMFKSLFSPKRRAAYAAMLALSAVCCAVATFFFLRGMRASTALALLVFTVNQLAGVAMLEGSALLPMPERGRLAVNLAAFSAFSAASLLICRYVARVDSLWLMLAYDAVFMVLLLLKHFVRFRGVEMPDIADEAALDEMEGIYAYRQYRRMAANALTSIEVTVMLLGSYLLAIPEGSGGALLIAAQLMAVFGVGIWACRLLLNRKRMKALGSDIAFFLFALLWIYISFYTASHPESATENRWILPMVVASLCMASLSAVLLNMDRYMVVIGELGAMDSAGSRYSLFKNAAYHLGAVVSRLFILVLAAAVTVYYELTSVEVFEQAARTNLNKLFILPLFFLVPAAFSALQHPLTKYYEQKLGRYSIMKLSGKVSRALEQKLVLSLVKKGGKRVGIKLLRAAVKPFVTLKRIGVEHIDPKLFPSVFVCNHAEIFGPVASTVNIPFFNRPWIIEEMVDPKKIAAHLQTGFDHALWVPAPLRRRLGRVLGPVVLWIMRSMDPVPVYRNTIKDIAKTIALSAEALESDDNILIFPENPAATDGRYVVDGVGEFFEGFVNIARQYCRNTGKPLVFYSVYADSKRRTIRFSKGIAFDAAAPFAEERERVSSYLHEEMTRMAGER